MVYLKECPRCRGDMYRSSDIYGSYKECLQCGYMVDIGSANLIYEVLEDEYEDEVA